MRRYQSAALRLATAIAVTAAADDRDWPDRYGVLADYLPQNYLGQAKFPFTKSG